MPRRRLAVTLDPAGRLLVVAGGLPALDTVPADAVFLGRFRAPPDDDVDLHLLSGPAAPGDGAWIDLAAAPDGSLSPLVTDIVLPLLRARAGGSRDDPRPGEVLVPLPERIDAGLVFIGTIRTPWTVRSDCPSHGAADGPPCRIEVDPSWADGLAGMERHGRLQILYWMHLARRDVMVQRPKGDGRILGTFTVRSPIRPNPVASSVVDLIGIEGCVLHVRGLDCLDRTPLIDIKPHYG